MTLTICMTLYLMFLTVYQCNQGKTNGLSNKILSRPTFINYCLDTTVVTAEMNRGLTIFSFYCHLATYPVQITRMKWAHGWASQLWPAASQHFYLQQPVSIKWRFGPWANIETTKPNSKTIRNPERQSYHLFFKRWVFQSRQRHANFIKVLKSIKHQQATMQ